MRTPGDRSKRETLERAYVEKKRHQPGIAFPSARKQQYTLIVRFDLNLSITPNRAKTGLGILCDLLERIDSGRKKIEEVNENNESELLPLTDFQFTATLGFGIGFFEKLNIPYGNRPKKLYAMPDSLGLGDTRSYTLKQTDLILQLCSSKDYVNRWVYEYSHEIHPYSDGTRETTKRFDYLSEDQNKVNDILTALSGWASVTDVHYGFQRLDGRNLMGFHDGISNPDRLSLENIAWIGDSDDESRTLREGTYMVFQKIEHDLEQWRSLDENRQEEWVGRSKNTGLILGTISKEEDIMLASELNSTDPAIRRKARQLLNKLIEEQADPERRLFSEVKNARLRSECPVWSHIRKANPRQEDGAPKVLIYRRGYLFSEAAPNGRLVSGLLFICYQKDIAKGFEYIKKEFLNNKNFPVPQQRANFTDQELTRRHYNARFSPAEIRGFSPRERSLLGLDSQKHYNRAVQDAEDSDAQNTGRDGLSGPSELGVYAPGYSLTSVTLGGGYYFIPPIPSRRIRNIGGQFFDQ